MGTAENQQKTIATTGSPHVANSGPPDVCFLPGKKGPIPPPNMVPTTRATEHTTAKTVISGKPIVQKGDAIGPPSDPAHPGVDGGVKSGTYRKEARPTSGSPNVKTEGKQPARHGDPTTHNKANTVGAVVDKSLAPKAESAPRKPEERCTATELVLKCSHGRETTAKEQTLDVLKGDTVTCTSTRKNLLKPGEPPAECPPVFPGRHEKTKFTITRTGPEATDKKGPSEYTGKDVYTLSPGDWIPKADDNLGPGELSGGATQRRTEGQREAGGKWVGSDNRTFGTQPKGPDGVTPANRTDYGFQDMGGYSGNSKQRRQQRRADQQAGNPTREEVRDQRRADFDRNARNADLAGSAANAVSTGANLIKNYREMVQLYKADPVVVTVETQGCTGSQTRKLRVYPDAEKTFDIFKMREIISAFEKFRAAFKVVEWLATALQIGSFKFKLLEPISCELRLSWKELERDSPKNPRLTKQRCNREWTLAVGGTFLEFNARADIPAFAPLKLAGSIAQKAANWLRDKFPKAQFVFKAALKLTMSFNFMYDRYEKLTLGGVEVKPSIDLSFGFELGLGRTALSVEIGFKIEPQFLITTDPTKYLVITLQQGTGKVYLKVVATLDIFGWWEASTGGDWVIAEVPYGEMKADLAGLLGK
jgi:uncharacterized Zn-binding protein involved in type VI secretion